MVWGSCLPVDHGDVSTCGVNEGQINRNHITSRYNRGVKEGMEGTLSASG